jgi:hypothetical protein
MAVVSAAVLLAAIRAMLWLKLRKRAQQSAQQMTNIEVPLDESARPSLDRAGEDAHAESDAIGIVGVDEQEPRTQC